MLSEEQKKSAASQHNQNNVIVHDKRFTGSIWPTIKYLMTFYAVAMVTSVGAMFQAWNITQVRPVFLLSFDRFSKGLIFAFLLALLSIMKLFMIETSRIIYGKNDYAWILDTVVFTVTISLGIVAGYSQFFCTITSVFAEFYKISGIISSPDFFSNLASCGGAFLIIDTTYALIVDVLKYPGNFLARYGDNAFIILLAVIGFFILLSILHLIFFKDHE